MKLRAQSGAGSIQGTIQDATGAAVPGCPVHVVNQKTGVTTDTTSNYIGFYSVPGLFAAGSTTGGIQGGPNGGYVGGLATAATFGYIAAGTIAVQVRAGVR